MDLIFFLWKAVPQWVSLVSYMDYTPLFDYLKTTELKDWTETLAALVEERIDHSNNGHFEKWANVLGELPEFQPENADVKSAVSFKGEYVSGSSENAEALLKQLKPWRKGPLDLGEIEIDTEWRSDWKWDRIINYITPLKNRAVLDVGCGNGYHLWRMIGEGASLALGIDPYLLFVMQFWATKHFAPKDLNAWVLPLGWEDLPENLPHFDTVFCMGVLYHRKSPFEFLSRLQNYLKPGGELVLETLVIDGVRGQVLVPDGRYAKMRNVWFIPSVPELIAWLKRVGWENVRCVDESVTSVDEQRSTDWMAFESLSKYLDESDISKTVEGHPSPRRAVFIANR